MPFPVSENILDYIVSFLDAKDVAILGSVSRMFHETSRNDATWGEFYIRAFLPHVTVPGSASASAPTARTATWSKIQRTQYLLSVIPRTIADTNLSVYQLFSRKAQRRLFKAVPLVMGLGLYEPSSYSLPTSLSASVTMFPIPPLLTLEDTVNGTLSRSRGESIDIQTLPVPERIAAVEATFIGVGAMRFVHLSNHGIILGCTDQGHLAVWSMQHLKQHKLTAIVTKKENTSTTNNTYSSIQSDIFAHAIGAKARRDAKRKYLGRNAQKESRLVYFKIKAANTKKNKHNPLSPAHTLLHGKDSKNFDTDDDFDVWGQDTNGTTTTTTSLPSNTIPVTLTSKETEKNAKGLSVVSTASSRSSSLGENNTRLLATHRSRQPSLSVDDDGNTSESTTTTTATLPRHHTDNSSDNENTESFYSFDPSNNNPNLSHGIIDSDDTMNGSTTTTNNPHELHPLDAWEAPGKDNRRHYRKKSTGTDPGQSSNDEEELLDINGGSRSGTKSKRKGSDASDKKRGKDLWSPADRAKYDEKQAKWASKQQAKMEKEKGSSGTNHISRSNSQPSSPKSEGMVPSTNVPSRTSSTPNQLSLSPNQRSPFFNGTDDTYVRHRRTSSHGDNDRASSSSRRYQDSIPSLSLLPSIPSADQLAEALSQQAALYRRQNETGITDESSIALNFDHPSLRTEGSDTQLTSPRTVQSAPASNRYTYTSEENSENDSGIENTIDELTSAFRTIRNDFNGSPIEKPTSLGRKFEKQLRAKERRADREAIKVAKRRGEAVSPRAIAISTEIRSTTPLKGKSPPMNGPKFIPASPPLPPRSNSSGKLMQTSTTNTTNGIGVAIGKEPRSPPLLAVSTGAIDTTMDSLSVLPTQRTLSNTSTGSTHTKEIMSTGNVRSTNPSSPTGKGIGSSSLSSSGRNSPELIVATPSRNPSPKLGGSTTTLPNKVSVSPTSNLTNKPKGSQLRSDVWVTSHWVRHEIPIARQRKPETVVTNPTDHASSGISLSIPEMEPRPLGSGEAITYHALLAFADGTLGVLVPQSISLRPNDVVVIGSNPFPSDTMNSLGSARTPTLEPALYLHSLRPRTSSHSGFPAGMAPYVDDSSRWLNRGMTWLERPPGEEKERITAATVCKGRHYIHRTITNTTNDNPSPFLVSPTSSSSFSNVGSTRDKLDIVSNNYTILTDIEPDVIIAAFGRVVGVWLYTDRSSRKDRVHGSNAGPHDETVNHEREGAKSPGGTYGTISKKALRKQQLLEDTGIIDNETTNTNSGNSNSSTTNPSRTLSGSSTSSHHSSNSTTDTNITEDLDYSLQPYTVFRGHSNVITSVYCWRKRLHTGIIAPSNAPASYGGNEGLTALESGIIAVVSGDAQGELCLWHIHEPSSLNLTNSSGSLKDIPTLTRIATLPLNSRKGIKEGISCVAMDSDFIVAGGSEGTVTAWRRKFIRVPSVASLPSVASVNARDNHNHHTEMELVPDVLFRENRAHSIVRVVQVPGGRTQVSAILSGGGEGDVRLWPIPTTISSSSTTASVALTPLGPSSPPLSVFGTINPSSLSSSAAIPLTSTTTASSVGNTIMKECRLLKGHQSRISGLYFNTTIIITTSLDGNIKIWDLQAPHLGRLLHSSRVPNNEEISSLHCTGTDILVGTVEGHIYTLSFGSIYKTLPNQSNSTVSNSSLASSILSVSGTVTTSYPYNNSNRTDSNNNNMTGTFNSEVRMRDIRSVLNQG